MAVMKHPPRGAVRQEECVAAGAEILAHTDLQEGSKGRRLALSKRSPIFSRWNGVTMVKTLREKKPIRRAACKLYGKLRDALWDIIQPCSAFSEAVACNPCYCEELQSTHWPALSGSVSCSVVGALYGSVVIYWRLSENITHHTANPEHKKETAFISNRHTRSVTICESLMMYILPHHCQKCTRVHTFLKKAFLSFSNMITCSQTMFWLVIVIQI